MTQPYPEHSGRLPLGAADFLRSQEASLSDRPADEVAGTLAAFEGWQAAHAREQANYQLITGVVGQLPATQDLDIEKLQLYGLHVPAHDVPAAMDTARAVQAHTLWLGEPRHELPYFIVGQRYGKQTTDLLLCAPSHALHPDGQRPMRQVSVWHDEYALSRKAVELAQFRPYTSEQLQAMYDQTHRTLRLTPEADSIRSRTADYELKRPLFVRNLGRFVAQRGISVAKGQSFEGRIDNVHMTAFDVGKTLMQLVYALRKDLPDLYEYLGQQLEP